MSPYPVDYLTKHLLAQHTWRPFRRACTCGWHQRSHGSGKLNHPAHVTGILAGQGLLRADDPPPEEEPPPDFAVQLLSSPDLGSQMAGYAVVRLREAFANWPEKFS